MFKKLIYLYIFMKKVYKKKIHTFYISCYYENGFQWQYYRIGDDYHDDLSFYSRRRLGNIVVLLITLTLHCFPMIILITLYFQDIYANPLSLRVMWPHRQYSSRFSLRYSCNITNVYPSVTAAVSHSSCKNHAYFPWFL